MRSYFLLVCTISFISYLFFLYYKRFRFNNESEKSFKYFLNYIPSITILWFLIYFSYYEAAPYIGDNPPFWHTSIITIMIFGVVTIIVKPPYQKFLSTNTTKVKGGGWNYGNYKKVKNIVTYDVHTYPRVTIFKNKEILFDSSDFEVVNKTLRTFESEQPSFHKDFSLDLEGTLYKIDNVRVDFLEVFLDYTEAQSKIYKGKSIPYNIQISVYVEKSM